MEALDETLYERVDEIISSHKGLGASPLLATTTTHAVIQELIARNDGLEKAVREIALDVQRLDAAHRREAATMP
jgi:hypothetical protein